MPHSGSGFLYRHPRDFEWGPDLPPLACSTPHDDIPHPAPQTGRLSELVGGGGAAGNDELCIDETVEKEQALLGQPLR